MGVLLYVWTNALSYEFEEREPRWTWLLLVGSVGGIALMVSAIAVTIRLWRRTAAPADGA
ncbi:MULTISPECIES: hypothetical protein [unclassified Nocardia]|uniref:hypothetical protein n=1 Tax=unclassified Nocardia TaxID=2637762 RepID=UPI0024A87D67|nr:MULTISPECIES: hypothetical protein [unclassified Nocardia]